MPAWVCTGSGGCGDLIAVVVLATIGVLVAVALVGVWIVTRVRRSSSSRSRALDDRRDIAGR